MAKKTKLAYVKIIDIHEPDEGLRKVDRTNEEYMGLVASIRKIGISDPISVREIDDPETGTTIYGLVNGLQRLTACKDIGMDEIPCHVISIEDGELLEAQIMANVHRIETKPVEYSKALLKILSDNPLLTRSELADRLAKTSAWISERLNLLKLIDQVGELVDEGKIGLSNAYALSKLPPEEQENFVDRALTMPPQQFIVTVNARVKEIRDAKRKGKDASPEEFQPVPLLRGRSELVSEMENAEIGPAICAEENVKSIDGGFALGIKWALNLDSRSCEIQKALDEERRLEKAKAKEKGQVVRKQKRAKEAAEKAESLKKEADEAEDEENKKASEEAEVVS